MIEDVRVVSVPVSDQEQARDFYADTDTLGFELRADRLCLLGTAYPTW